MIPYGRQEITDADIEAVIGVLKSDYLTQGPKVPEFEKSVTDYCKVKHGIAVNSATSALHVACLALGVGEGDMVWTSPITFVASANCARFCGADIDFVDIDPKTYNMCPVALEKKLKQAAIDKRLPKVVIPVHLTGQSCEMKALKELSDQYDFAIIEDACHAIGGCYNGLPIGNCKYSDITVFSFHPVKIITTAEGGMAVTNSNHLAASMQLARSHGITRDSEKFEGSSDGAWYYQQICLGYNYRMTDMQAALGISQIRRLSEVIKLRHSVAKRYNTLLSEMPILLPYQDPNNYSAFHLYVIRIDDCNLARREVVFDYLRDCGIGVNVHYIPVHTQPYYKKLGFKSGDFPHAEDYYTNAISIPMYHHLKNEDQDHIVASLIKVVENTEQ